VSGVENALSDSFIMIKT